MWDKIWGYIQQVFSVTRRLDDAEEDIVTLSDQQREDRQDNDRRDDKMDYLTQAVQRIAFEHERDRENAETEREMQRLRLEVLLLQATNRLPPGQTPPDPEKEELRAMVEELKRKAEELTERLEQSEQK